MKKNFRFLSAVLAACMSLTMFAGAVDTSAETETLTGTVHIMNDDGSMVDIPYEYVVPVDAEEEEADEIGMQAACQIAQGNDNARGISNMTTVFKKVYSDNGMKFEIPRGSAELSDVAISRRLSQDLDAVALVVKGLSGCNRLNASVYNKSHDEETVYKVETASSNMEVMFFNRCVADDGHSILFLDEGDRIEGRISADRTFSATAFYMLGLVY